MVLTWGANLRRSPKLSITINSILIYDEPKYQTFLHYEFFDKRLCFFPQNGTKFYVNHFENTNDFSFQSESKIH